MQEIICHYHHGYRAYMYKGEPLLCRSFVARCLNHYDYPEKIKITYSRNPFFLGVRVYISPNELAYINGESFGTTAKLMELAGRDVVYYFKIEAA